MSDQKTVLVVDDNESSRYLLSRWMRQAEFRVEEASTGGEALSAVASGSYALILLDVNLPDMTGYAVCSAIKADPVTGALPVIHVSATAVGSDHRTAGLRGGADAYLVEPLERHELLATVDAVLRISEARRQAELLGERLRKLHRTSLELNAAPDLNILTQIAARSAREMCGRPAAAGTFSDSGGTFAYCDGDGTHFPLALSVEDSHALLASPETALSRLVPDSALNDGALRSFKAQGRKGFATTGLLLVEGLGAGDDALETVLRQLAQTVGVAAENLELRTREHQIAVTLQRSLLGRIATVPWLDIAVRYIPGATQMEVGGDFYDVLRLDNDQVAVVIGDVEGHSLYSATVMAAIRNSLAAYLLAGHPPGSAIDLVDHVLQMTYPDTIATVCCIVLGPDGTATIANGGHLPPVHKTRGSASALPATGLLLGAGGQRSQTTYRLGEGDVVVQFTDGLVERRGHSIADGMAAATAIIADATDDVEAICDRLLQELASSQPITDDIAIIAFRLAPLPA
jgi:CheY-like chemotaxis protein